MAAGLIINGPFMADTPSLSVITNVQPRNKHRQICFDRRELQSILDVYARMVTFGEWKDYSIDVGRDTASFNIYRRASEMPVYSIVKEPALARKQGAFRLLAANRQVIKRGHGLGQVLGPLKAQMIKVVESG